MTANKAAQKTIRRDLLKSKLSPKAQEAAFVLDYLGECCRIKPSDGHKYYAVHPATIGAFTDCICIARYGAMFDDADFKVWGDMDYSVRNFLEELSLGREVIWKKG